MSNKLIFRKAKELHYKTGGKNPQVTINAIQDELQLTSEDMKYYLESLQKLRLIKFTDENGETIELTKVGLSTMI